MQSRMDKYNTVTEEFSRTKKNQDLYENVKNSSLTDFDLNSNVSIIGDNSSTINVNDVKNFLDKRYSDSEPKRRSIEIPEYEDLYEVEPLADTKEYDINTIIKQAKLGKNIDYNKERLKKVRDAQFEILNNLDLEPKKEDTFKREEAEENLRNLINTITEFELKNKTENLNKETSEALDLLDMNEKTTKVEEVKEDSIEPKIELAKPEDVSKESHEDHIEKTLSKLDISMSSYEDFADVSKRDIGSIILKVAIFLILVGLLIGGLYIVNNALGLELFG